MTRRVILPMIPEPLTIKEAYHLGFITDDEALRLIIGIDPDAEREPHEPRTVTDRFS